MYEQKMCVTADKIYFMISPLSTLVPLKNRLTKPFSASQAVFSYAQKPRADVYLMFIVYFFVIFVAVLSFAPPPTPGLI